MVNYAKSVIYKLCCKDPSITDVYVGSTINKNRRKQQHKSCCNNENIENNKSYNYYVYEFIRSHGGFFNWDMVVIEDFPCNSKQQLETRERYWLDELKATLNKQIPTRTRQEYNEINCDKITKNLKEKIICECGTEISKRNLSKHRKLTKIHLEYLESI